jgi:hypothetical protein
MKVAMQRVGLELGKSVAKECVNALVNYGVDQLLMKNIEKEIAARVTEKVIQSLMQSSLVQAACALDVKNKNNHWQNLLLREGMNLLAEKKDHKVLYALKEVAKGVASNKIAGANAVFQSVAMLKALNEVLNMTDDFLASFHKKLEKDYEKKIKSEQASQQEEETQQQQVHQQISIAPPPIDTANLEAPIIKIKRTTRVIYATTTMGPLLTPTTCVALSVAQLPVASLTKYKGISSDPLPGHWSIWASTRC